MEYFRTVGLPPSREAVRESCLKFGIPTYRAKDPFYGNPADVTAKSKAVVGAEVEDIPAFSGRNSIEHLQWEAVKATFGEDVRTKDANIDNLASETRMQMRTVSRPPTRKQVVDWFRVRAALRKEKLKSMESQGRSSTSQSAIAGADDDEEEDEDDGNSAQSDSQGFNRTRSKFLVKNDDDSDYSELSCSSPDSSPPPQRSSSSRIFDLTLTENIDESESQSDAQSSGATIILPSEVPLPPSPPTEVIPPSPPPDGPRSSGSSTKPISGILKSRSSSCLSLSRLKRRRISWDKSSIGEQDKDDLSASIGEDDLSKRKEKRELKNDNSSLSSQSSSSLSHKLSGQSQELMDPLSHEIGLEKMTGSLRRTSTTRKGHSLRQDEASANTELNLIEDAMDVDDVVSEDKSNEAKRGPPDKKQEDADELTQLQSADIDREDDNGQPLLMEIDHSSSEKLDDSLSASILQKIKSPGARARYLTPEAMNKTCRSQIGTPKADNPKPVFDLQKAAGLRPKDYLTMLSIELHVKTRQKLRPDPDFDSIEAVFYTVVHEEGTIAGCIVVSPDGKDLARTTGIVGMKVRHVATEILLLKNVVKLVRDADPDILAGYEIQLLSWGYLFRRANYLGFNLCPLISRVPDSVRESRMMDDEENPGAAYNADHTSEIQVVGRIVFNLWRMMRGEVALYSYTLENVALKVLGVRRPCYSFETLTKWWEKDVTRYKVLQYYSERLELQVNIISRLDLLSRTSELARLFGIQFFEVFSRGSQYRVEATMLRIVKARGYVALSPSRLQLAAQAAPEYLALLLEPESRMYTDPVIVLDFQSLYPSIIIGYNYCYSTCLGRVSNLATLGNYTFGCSVLSTNGERLRALKDHVTISPGGIVFVKPHVRRGVLPDMLQDILNTRIMVKKSMKKHSKDPDLQKILYSRQLGLKLIANVTYGYTSANFSGRMPCIEVGDSVVAKGRETLERAIRTVESNEKWGARVVYGDTDSIFVLLKGKTKDEAFDIGEEIADVITKQNPKPVKLKFEKVYLPCILQTKKRYVGYMYETRDQQKPEYDAKGIETVRRDGIPATAKILEKSIRILFETKDLSQVKSYVQNQFTKIVSGTISLQELTFAKEFRGLNGYRPGACVPALELTRQSMRMDRMSIPRTGERVPYVIIYGEPGLPLIQLVRDPKEVLNNHDLRPNAHYYITKVIVPPLNRCFLLVGVDTASWYTELPRVIRTMPTAKLNKKGVISQYFACQSCLTCGQFSVSLVCPACRAASTSSLLSVSWNIADIENRLQAVRRVCMACDARESENCVSLDCPHMYRKKIVQRESNILPSLHKVLDTW